MRGHKRHPRNGIKRFPHSKGRTVIATEPSGDTTGLRSPDHHLLWLDVPAHCSWLLGLDLQCSPFKTFIDLTYQSSLAVSGAGILIGQRLSQLSTHWLLCTRPLSPLATHSSHPHSASRVGCDGFIFIGCLLRKLGPYWLPIEVAFPLTASPVDG